MLVNPEYPVDPLEFPPIGEFAVKVEQAQQWAAAFAERRFDDHPTWTDADVDDLSAQLFANIEQLQIAEEELRQQNEELERSRLLLEYAQSRYQELFEFAPDAYLVTDLFGSIRELNRAASALLGVTGGYGPGKPLVSFVHPGQRTMVRTMISTFSGGGGAATWDFDLVGRDGVDIPVSARIVRSQPEVGQSAGLLWIIRDVTSQVAAERALRAANEELEQRVATRTEALEQALARESRANQGKAEFLASLSHEVRTPLHAMMAYTELLEHEVHGPITELQRHDLHRMRRGHEHMLGLVNRILDFARLENGQTVLHPERVAVSTVVRSVLDIVRPKSEEGRVHCLEPAGPEPACVLADLEAMRQILINLVGNAIKFNVPYGTVAVYWEVTDDQVGIHVRDTGPGIATSDLDFIFEPFVRLAEGGQVKIGTGLGLPISRSLATAMQGSIGVDSRPDDGATFTLWLPRAPELTANDASDGEESDGAALPEDALPEVDRREPAGTPQQGLGTA